MYKIVSFRYESVIQKNCAPRKIFFAPPNHKSVPTALIHRWKNENKFKWNSDPNKGQGSELMQVGGGGGLQKHTPVKRSALIFERSTILLTHDFLHIIMLKLV